MAATANVIAHDTSVSLRGDGAAAAKQPRNQKIAHVRIVLGAGIA
jgi:hypothetical protein